LEQITCKNNVPKRDETGEWWRNGYIDGLQNVCYFPNKTGA